MKALLYRVFDLCESVCVWAGGLLCALLILRTEWGIDGIRYLTGMALDDPELGILLLMGISVGLSVLFKILAALTGGKNAAKPLALTAPQAATLPNAQPPKSYAERKHICPSCRQLFAAAELAVKDIGTWTRPQIRYYCPHCGQKMTAQTDRGVAFRLFLGLMAGVALLGVLQFTGVIVWFAMIYIYFAKRHIQDRQTYVVCDD